MNENIKRLVIQANKETQALMIMEYRNFESRLYERLSELIIKECGAIQRRRFCEHGDVSWDLLLDHFGISHD